MLSSAASSEIRFSLNHAAGSVIIRVYPEQVGNIEIPRLGASREQEIDRLILESFEHRHRSKCLIREAVTLLREANQLPNLPRRLDDEPDYFTIPSAVYFHIGSEFRLTAHFQNSIAREAIRTLETTCEKLTTVGAVCKEIRMSPLFVRKYVDPGNGIPYIAGKQISQIRPDFKYISRTETENLEIHLLHRDWTLVTCAGSVGKIGFVSSVLDRVAAQDVMRVIPAAGKIDSGYLNAWLRSEYGQVQLQRYRYGSVVDRISPEHIGSVLMPQLTIKQQEQIGDCIRRAYNWRDQALQLENEAISLLVQTIKR